MANGSGERRGRGSLRDLLRGLRAGDLERVLLTVAAAAEENRVPSADPDEAARILAFLAKYDAALPPPRPGGTEAAPDRSSGAGRPRRRNAGPAADADPGG